MAEKDKLGILKLEGFHLFYFEIFNVFVNWKGCKCVCPVVAYGRGNAESIFLHHSSHMFRAFSTFWQPLQFTVTFSDKLWTSFSLSEFFLKPFPLPLLNHPLIQRKGPENWLSFNAATARTLSLNKVSVA